MSGDIRHRDVVIVGGGVIGLSIAYALSQEGVTSSVLDRRELGREASWAGAGLLPPQSERPGTHPIVALRSRSAQLYEEWSAQLLEETGIDNGYRRTGGVDVASNDEEEHELRTAVGRWKAEGITYERMAPADFGRVEPALNPELRVAYYLPDRAQIRNPWHLRALMTALAAHGCRLAPGAGVEGFEVQGGRVVAVRTSLETIACDAVVVAAGAWSGGLLETVGISAPTPPVKGQMVLLRSDRPLLRRIVEHGPNYLVPRDDGRILVGATEENAGFDTRTTAQGVRGLLDEAIRLCPTLASAQVETSWAGLRPGSIDTRPYLGLAPAFKNLYVATGHRRAGLQLSPGTAEIVTDLILGRSPKIDVSSFQPGREPAPELADSFRS